MADSTSDRIATSPVAQGVCNRRISAVWLMWFINLMLFISFLPYERKIKCIFLTTLLICLFQKTFLKNCCSGRNSSTKLEDCRIRTLCRMPRKSSPWVPDIRQDAVIKTSNQGKSHLLVLGKKSQGLRVEILRSAKYYPSLDFLESSIIAARGMEAVFFRSSCPTASRIRVQGRCSCWGVGGKAPKVSCD